MIEIPAFVADAGNFPSAVAGTVPEPPDAGKLHDNDVVCVPEVALIPTTTFPAPPPLHATANGCVRVMGTLPPATWAP